jgi:hypothetical protein
MHDPTTRANALDHVVVVLFENRSLDNVLGRLYGPWDGKTFEGVIGKELSNQNREPARRPSPVPSARWLRTFGSVRVGRAMATLMV